MTEEAWFTGGEVTAMAEYLDQIPVAVRDIARSHAVVTHELAARIPSISNCPAVSRFLTAHAKTLDGRLPARKLRDAKRHLESYVQTREATESPDDGVPTALRILANVGVRHHLITSTVAVYWFLQVARGATPPVPDYERDACQLLRCVFGNPFRRTVFDPRWRTETVVGLADGICEIRAFERMPILADALQEAGCEHPDILTHCREPGVHVRGCWVVDLVLGKA